MLESIKRVLLPISVPAFLGTFFILFTKTSRVESLNLSRYSNVKTIPFVV